MLKNYLKVALRNLQKNPGYSFINIAGLSVGIFSCIVILLHVQYEMSYDTFHEKSDRIYRVTVNDLLDEKHWAAIAPVIGDAFEEQVPGISDVTRFTSFSEVVLGSHQNKFKEEDILYADSNVFKLFTFPLEHGDPNTALQNPFSIVLTRNMAIKYFGTADVVGKTLVMNAEYDLRVTGVLENIPDNTHLPVKFLVSMSTFYSLSGDWVNTAKNWKAFYTYVLLDKGTTKEEVESRSKQFVNSFFEPERRANAAEEQYIELQPLESIHLHSDLEKEWRSNGNISYVYLFAFAGIFVLGVAIINFVNLATARSMERAREVGIRKAIGANRKNLVVQFLFEFSVLTLLSLIVALLFCELALPYIGGVIGKASVASIFMEPIIWVIMPILVIIISVMAGFYPAFILSRFQPANTLKGTITSVTQGTSMRKGLVIFQFSLAILLMVGMVVIHQQTQFLLNKSLGFEKEHVIDVQLNNSNAEWAIRYAETIKERFLSYPEIQQVSYASEVPGERISVEEVQLSERPEYQAMQSRIIYGVDHDFIPTLGLEVTQGRNFSPKRDQGSTVSFILNESAISALNLENPIGERVIWRGQAGEIVGVVNNFNYESLHHKIEPLVILYRPEEANEHILVKAGPRKAPRVLEVLEKEWSEMHPGSVFNYNFLDQKINNQYQTEKNATNIIMVFSFVALFVSCMGLFGLSSFMVKKRRKEIGVRKVLGANTSAIILMLLKDFIKLVLLAFIIAAPIAFWMFAQWLNNYAYHIEISWLLIISVGLITLVIATLTVGWQSTRVALTNPVDSLRSE